MLQQSKRILTSFNQENPQGSLNKTSVDFWSLLLSLTIFFFSALLSLTALITSWSYNHWATFLSDFILNIEFSNRG